MTVESNYLIAIATLSDWLKRVAPVFKPMRSKTKINRTMYRRQSFENRSKSEIGLLQLAITWYKIRHAGGQGHYYSSTGTLKQRDLNQ